MNTLNISTKAVRAAGAAVICVSMLTACDRGGSAESFDAVTRAAIASQIAAGIEATRSKDIDAYLAQIPDDIVLRDQTGEPISMAEIREQVLQAWATIERTRVLDVLIDTIMPRGDSAIVITTQHWDRLVFRPDGSALDTIVSVKRQQETWKRTSKGWRSYDVVPMGGTTTVNGEVFHQQR